MNHEYTCLMTLKPQDLLVALKLWAGRAELWSYPELASSLGMSVGETHSAVKRAVQSGLLKAPGDPRKSRQAVPAVNRGALREFLVHGAKYAFPVVLGGITRGVPTAYGALPLLNEFNVDPTEIPVWPYAHGKARGPKLEPLWKSVPQAAERDDALHALLALFDAIRVGRARERARAIEHLDKLLK